MSDQPIPDLVASARALGEEDFYQAPATTYRIINDLCDALDRLSAEKAEGDLTTPMEPNALYQSEADIVSFLERDVVTVARRVGERFDVLLSMDRTEVVGFQIWGASTFGKWLLDQNPSPPKDQTHG